MGVTKLLVCLALIFANALAAAAAIEDLIASYSYDFYNGTINATSQNDYMIDKNSNGKNDTLVINITIDAASGTYRFIVEIADDSGILLNSTKKALTSSDASANINFPSELLAKSKFNYSIRINDNSNNLVFRKSGIESQSYKNYETGTNVTLIRDEKINNNFIRLNLTIDSQQALTANITVTLAYNSSTISKTVEKALSSGVQKVSIDFDNETIKNTHYAGSFTIDKVVVGNKIFDFNQNTSIYNYEDFAKTPYIKSIADGRIDTNGNNLSEFLELNFTIEVKTADAYTINYELYDQFGNFVANGSKTEALNAGMQTMRTLINGSGIYKTKINGPYVLSFAKLSINNEAKDIVFNAHTTTQTFYTDYEKPNLPDLKVMVNKDFNNKNNITSLTVNLSNIGNAPAFSIFLDVFDNETYSNNASLGFLDKNDFVIYNFSIGNTSNATLFTAIADFDNLVDEGDETNNIANSLIIIANDLDGDGIDDAIDTLIGDISSVNTTISNLAIKIGNLTDLSQAFNGTWKISFVDNGIMLMEFDFNLSKVLNLSRIMVEKQSNSSFGYTLINGLSLDGNTKTIYVGRVDTRVNGICVKDAEIASISEISNNCSSINEIKIECDGTLQGSYACGYNSTTSRYQITGLNNSGARQIDYAKPADSASVAASGGGGSSSGGDGSGSCLENWQCNEWSECINNLQTRTCQDANSCGTIFNKPSEAELCAINEKSALDSIKADRDYNKKSENGRKYFLPDITGFLLGPSENTNPAIGAFIVLFIIMAGLLGYFYFKFQQQHFL